MKKVYAKPTIEIEIYQMSADIAANCGVIVSTGPYAPGHIQCEEYKDSGFDGWSLFVTGRTPFYNDGSANCDCYYTSGGNNTFAS